MTRVRLLPIEERDFEWLIGRGAARDGLRLADGGVEERDTLEHIRRLTTPMLHAGYIGAWLIVARDEVVGLCGFHASPSRDGDVMIGYGIAASRRRLGYMTQALAGVVRRCSRDPAIARIVAETAVANLPSQAVLLANDFVRSGSRIDSDDGELIRWSRTV